MQFYRVELKSLSKSFYLAKNFVTCSEFLEYLNFDGHSNIASDGSYKYYNFVNPDLPIFLDGDRYLCKPNCCAKPVTGLSWKGAQAYANFRGFRLLTLSEWTAMVHEGGLSKDGISLRNKDRWPSENIDYETQFTPLYESFSIGISTWLQPDNFSGGSAESLIRENNKSQYVAGYGFNKTVNDMDNNWLYQRWGRTGAISVGLRCVRDETG